MNPSILETDIEQFAQTFPLAESLRDKQFLITGATGLIGSIMVKCLLALDRRFNLGIRICCPVRSRAKAESVFGPADSRLSFCNALPTADVPRVDYLVHFAAPTASKYFIDCPVETFEAVVGQTLAWLRYAREQKLKGFVYVSSLEVYGTITDDTQPVTEDFQGYIEPMDVRSSYSMGKRAAECACHAYAKQYGVPVSIARLTQTFGAGIAETDQRVFAQFARSVVRREDIVLHTEATLSRPYCYTTDAISALLYLLLRGKSGEAYNVANDASYISVRHMAQFMVDRFAPDIAVRMELQEHCGYAPSTKLRLDSSKMRALGWQPQLDLTEMFGRLIAYLQAPQSQS